MDNMQRAWVEVNLDSIAHNVRQIKSILKPGTKLMGVVKADAYGHGVYTVSKTILESGADSLAVALIDEAVQLRKYGIDAPVLILGNSAESSIEDLIEYDIMPSVFTLEFAKLLSKKASECGKELKVHVKVDTGMGRIGFVYGDDKAQCDETLDAIKEIYNLPGIKLEGLFTHFATADEADETYTKVQFEHFCKLCSRLEEMGINIPVKHTANSAAQIRFEDMQLDMVRAGIILYGMYPSEEKVFGELDLRPAMTFKTMVTYIKEMEKDSAISYGKTYVTPSKKKIATIAIGYADGYSRLLSDKAQVSVDGVICPQVGRICMDQCMIDVTNVNNINIGDEVTLFGGEIPVEDIAAKMGTINYEVVCMVGNRIPRVYIKDKKIVDEKNALLS